MHFSLQLFASRGDGAVRNASDRGVVIGDLCGKLDGVEVLPVGEIALDGVAGASGELREGGADGVDDARGDLTLPGFRKV